MLTQIQQFLAQIKPTLQASQTRIALVVHGSSELADSQLEDLFQALPMKAKLVISPRLQNALDVAKAKTLLGEEYDLVVFDARGITDTQVFDVDALGVVSGVLKGGGCLLLLLPGRATWQQLGSRYLRRLQTLLHNNEAVYYLENLQPPVVGKPAVKEPPPGASNPGRSRPHTAALAPYKNIEQQQLVQSLVPRLLNEARLCTVLVSGRGRGKSASLGFIVAELFKHKAGRVLISAPRLSVTQPSFYHLGQQCTGGELGRGRFSFNDAQLSFIAPDELVEQHPEAELLLVDEAAAIPLSMLETLLKRYPRIIFSTTSHGYEGTGRGFVLKFFQLLDQQRPGWELQRLHQPVRWAQGDPLEAWIEKLLCLDLNLATGVSAPQALQDCEFALLERDSLIENETRLEAVFSLLVMAHYRTRPSDFQYMLDQDNIRIYTLSYQQNILAVLVINQEGEFDKTLCREIYRGTRRPRGHLLAQTLCFHAGFEQAAALSYARVMRIVVHPQVQRQGLGHYLLQQVIHSEVDSGMDIIGSSFAASESLMRFWQDAGMQLLRMGFKQDHVSATHSAVYALGLSSQGKSLVNAVDASLRRNLRYWLPSLLQGVQPSLKAQLASLADQQATEFNAHDRLDIQSYYKFNRNFEACYPAMARMLQLMPEVLQQLTASEQALLQLCIRHPDNWKLIVQQSGLSGRAQAEKALKSLLSHIEVVQS